MKSPMRLFGSVLIYSFLLMSLTACSLVGNRPSPDVVYVSQPAFPPSAYLQECYPIRPANPTLQEIIIAQSRAINQCNAQLESIRIWKQKQQETQDE